MRIPAQNSWTQNNSGDILGILHDTQNVTLDERGKLKLSRKAFHRFNSTDDANLTYVLALAYYSGQYLALTSDHMFLYDLGGSTTTEITSGSRVLNSDMQVIYSRAYFTENATFGYYDGSVTASIGSLTGNVPHPMAVFDSFTTYKLAIGNGNLVHLYDSSHNLATNVLTLPAQYQVTTIAYRNGYLYVGTKHTNGGEAKVFIWDGNSTNALYEVPTGATKVYSIIPYKDSVAYLTSHGQLLTLSGNTPIELAAFPVYYHPDAIWDDESGTAYIGKVMHRGMVAVGDTIYINVNGTVDSAFIPEMKHGLWMYDPRVGLYHRAFHSLDKFVVETPSNLASSTLTLSTHNLKTGDILVFRDVGSLTGVQITTPYYVYAASTTTVKLAISRKALQAGNYVTLGGSIGIASVHYVPNTDWAGGYAAYQGAVTAINPAEPVRKGWESSILWGSSVTDFSGTALYCLNGFVDAWNIGRFTTQRIYSNNISETFKKLYIYLDGINLDSEQVIVKYKSSGALGYPTQVYKGTWASATTITSLPATQTEDEWSDLVVGDEITVVDGFGRGYTAHITVIAVAGTDYTITIDESIGSSSKVMYFYADKFKKVSPVVTNTRALKEVIESELNVKSAWVQIKVELRGFEPGVTCLELTHTGDKLAV